MEIEEKYVKDFYNNNSKSFNDTRYAPWPIVKTFIDNLQYGLTICDIGCGNGKNQYRKDLIWLSCDNSRELCKYVEDAILCDCTYLPFKDQSCDIAICIAVLHHLSTEPRRLKALYEMKRILKKNGIGLISVWGSQPKYGCGDKIIGWNKNENQRYVHFFTYDEVKQLISCVFDQYKIVYDFNNYFIFVSVT